MIKFLTRYNFHFLLLPVFFVWHASNEYFGLVNWRYIIEYVGYYLALSIALFVIGKLLFKNNTKAALWAFIPLTIFFFFGVFHDFLKSNTFFSIISSYSILLPLICVIIVLAIIAIKRNKNNLVRPTAYLNALMLFLILLELQLSVYQFFTHEHKKNNLNYGLALTDIKVSNMPDSLKPDIFFIVFDEFASTKSLLQYVNFDNSNLDSAFKKHNFYIAKNSKSNFNATPFSLACYLNMQYPNGDFEGKQFSPRNALKAQYTVKESVFPTYLKNNNYSFKNYGILDLPNSNSIKESHFNFNFSKIFTLETLVGRIHKDIWWNVALKINGTAAIEKKITALKEPYTNGIIENYNNTYKALQSEYATPTFTYSHMLIPHSPFCFNKNGERRTLRLTDNLDNDIDSLYTDQLQYCNTLIKSLLTATTTTPTKRPRVVIIASDHGYRNNFTLNKTRDKEFSNLCTVYFSDNKYETLYDSISPVNIFRVVSNKYFNTNLPMIKDSSILLY